MLEHMLRIKTTVTPLNTGIYYRPSSNAPNSIFTENQQQNSNAYRSRNNPYFFIGVNPFTGGSSNGGSNELIFGNNANVFSPNGNQNGGGNSVDIFNKAPTQSTGNSLYDFLTLSTTQRSVNSGNLCMYLNILALALTFYSFYYSMYLSSSIKINIASNSRKEKLYF